jgi:hypothetical protein
VRIATLSQALWLLGPLALLAFAAGALRALGLRQEDPRRRRLLQFAWVALLFAGAPLWLFAGATLGLF